VSARPDAHFRGVSEEYHDGRPPNQTVRAHESARRRVPRGAIALRRPEDRSGHTHDRRVRERRVEGARRIGVGHERALHRCLARAGAQVGHPERTRIARLGQDERGRRWRQRRGMPVASLSRMAANTIGSPRGYISRR